MAIDKRNKVDLNELKEAQNIIGGPDLGSQRLDSSFVIPSTPARVAIGQSVEEAFGNLQSSIDDIQSTGALNEQGVSGNIVIVDPDGFGVTDSGISFGAEYADEIPNAGQVEQIIYDLIIDSPTLPTVAVATTANLSSLSGLPTIDGVALQAGQFVLVKNQTDQSQNGPYQVAAGAWVRVYFDGTQWLPVTVSQTKYVDLAIDSGIVQVNGGTVNGNISYKCAISNSAATLGTASVKVLFSKTTLTPVPDIFYRTVSNNNGNDTNNNGTATFPFKTIGQAFTGTSYPAVIEIAPSGSAYTEAVSVPAVASNVSFESVQNSQRGGLVRWSSPWTVAFPTTGQQYHTYRGITWATGSNNPFTITGGGGSSNQSIWMENCSFIGTMTDIAPTNAVFNGTLSIRNVDVSSAPLSSLVIKNNTGVYNFAQQNTYLPITLASGITGSGVTINIAASCNPGSIWIPLNFAGTINRSNPTPLSIVSCLTTQAALDALLVNTSAASSGFYLISGFSPTQNAALAGGVIGHFATGSAYVNWWERSYFDLPSVVSTATGLAYAKGLNNLWGIPEIIQVLTSAPTGSNVAGMYTQIGGVPPSGIPLNAVFWWDGAAGTLFSSFTFAPASISSAGISWSKSGSTWVPDGGIVVQSILTAAPDTNTVAGLYATNVAVGSASAGDLVYLPGGPATGTKYLSYADAPATLSAANASVAKLAGGWLYISSPTGSTVYTGPVTFGASVTAPVKPSNTLIDYITIIDDGSGWCHLIMHFLSASAVGATSGSGILLVNLLGGLKFDTAVHLVNASTASTVGATEVKYTLPGSQGYLSRDDNFGSNLAAQVYSPTQFFLYATGDLAGTVGVRQKMRSDFFQLNYGAISYSMAFRFKKG